MARVYRRVTDEQYRRVVVWYRRYIELKDGGVPRAQRAQLGVLSQKDMARELGWPLHKIEQIVTHRVRPDLGL